MATDKDLFLYDLVFVSIMKNEGHYIKEWLDYHLFAGVNHFFIYDNDSTDDMKEILQPYIEKNIVTYIFYPGKARQQEAYNDAVKNFRFYCRYMAFVDADEFFLPKSNRSITEVADEIFSDFRESIGGFAAHWFIYGSSGEEKADYTRGVLERFTRRKNKQEVSVKSITDPRKIDFMWSPHFPMFFPNFDFVDTGIENSVYDISEKIVVNHYITKSKEEYFLRKQKGSAVVVELRDNLEMHFKNNDFNDVFDDSILNYRAEREKISAGHENFNPGKCIRALSKNLSPLRDKNISQEFFAGKIETFLTCRSLAAYLRDKNFIDEETGNVLENLSLYAVCRSLYSKNFLPDLYLLISEMPNILKLPYPVVNELVDLCIETVSQIQIGLREGLKDRADLPEVWRKITELDYKLEMLKSFAALKETE